MLPSSQQGHFSTRVEYPTRKVELERAMRSLLPLVEESLAAKESAGKTAKWFLVLYVMYWAAVASRAMTFWWPLALVSATAVAYFALAFLEYRGVHMRRMKRLVVYRRELEQIAADEVASNLVETMQKEVARVQAEQEQKQ